MTTTLSCFLLESYCRLTNVKTASKNLCQNFTRPNLNFGWTERAPWACISHCLIILIECEQNLLILIYRIEKGYTAKFVCQCSPFHVYISFKKIAFCQLTFYQNHQTYKHVAREHSEPNIGTQGSFVLKIWLKRFQFVMDGLRLIFPGGPGWKSALCKRPTLIIISIYLGPKHLAWRATRLPIIILVA